MPVTARGINARLEVALTSGAAIDLTGMTKASPAVATATAHGLAAGVVGHLAVTVGAVNLDGQAGRAYNPTTNAFEIQGLSTLGGADFTTGSFIPVATWAVLAETTGYSYGGGSSSALDDTKLMDVVTQEISGSLPADTVQVDLLSQTVNGAAMKVIEDAAMAQGDLTFRITLHDGATRVFRGSPSRPGESLARGGLATGSFSVKVRGVVLKGAA